jgi:hypothetical protein
MQDEDRQPDKPSPTPSEGSAETSRTSVEPNQVSGAQFPPFEIAGEPLTSRNEDRVPPAPIGPLRGPLAPTSQEAISLKPKVNVDQAADKGAAEDLATSSEDAPSGKEQ